jgi:hypothetical protein
MSTKQKLMSRGEYMLVRVSWDAPSHHALDEGTRAINRLAQEYGGDVFKTRPGHGFHPHGDMDYILPDDELADAFMWAVDGLVAKYQKAFIGLKMKERFKKEKT